MRPNHAVMSHGSHFPLLIEHLTLIQVGILHPNMVLNNCSTKQFNWLHRYLDPSWSPNGFLPMILRATQSNPCLWNAKDSVSGETYTTDSGKRFVAERNGSSVKLNIGVKAARCRQKARLTNPTYFVFNLSKIDYYRLRDSRFKL